VVLGLGLRRSGARNGREDQTQDSFSGGRRRDRTHLGHRDGGDRRESDDVRARATEREQLFQGNRCLVPVKSDRFRKCREQGLCRTLGSYGEQILSATYAICWPLRRSSRIHAAILCAYALTRAAACADPEGWKRIPASRQTTAKFGATMG